MVQKLMLMIIMITLSLAAVSNASEAVDGKAPTGWADRITVSGTVEGDVASIKNSDFRDKDSDSSSDLFISAVELGVEAEIAAWITGGVVFLSEDLGTADETDVAVDEAVMTFDKEENPLYLVVGKRAQPFGVYENHLISDPMTQDAYETSAAGLTVGVTGPVGIDISVTVYKNNGPMAHLFESGLFETDDTAAEFFSGNAADTNISSYIASASISPIADHLTIFASLLSEKGATSSNDTYSVGIDYNCVLIEGFLIDAEYFSASSREPYTSNLGVADTFKESVFSATVAYVLGGGERGAPGTNYLVRRAHVFAEPVEIAFRYEQFDDDGMADKTGTWSEKNRYSAGVRYSFFEDEELGVAAYAALEYRKTEYELSSAMNGVAANDNNEVMARLGVSF